MSFVPIPCPPVTGGGGPAPVFDPGFDAETQILCDVVAGNVVGSALAVYEYDAETGAPVGPPTFVDPVTGAPYVVQGVLQPCDSVPGASEDQIDVEQVILCDANGQFIRVFTFTNGVLTGTADTDLTGAAYVPVAPITACPASDSSYLLEQGCVDLNTANNFFANFPASPGAWEYSGDSGGSYTPNPPTVQNQVTGPRGTQRYRQVFTIPAGATGTFDVTVSSDVDDISTGDNAEVFYDGVSQGVVTPIPGGPTTFTFPSTPGVHTFEIYIGASDDAAGLTGPSAQATYENSGPFVPIEIIKTVDNATGNITAVRYFDAAGNELNPIPSPNQVTIGECPSPTPDPTVQIDVEQQVLCDANGKFLRTYHYEDGVVTAAVDTDFQLGPYVPVPPIGACPDPTSPVVLGELCVEVPAGPPLSFSGGLGNAEGVEGPDNTFTYANYQGSGVTVTVVVDPGLAAAYVSGIHTQLNGAGNFPISVSFSQPVTVRGITFGEMDASFGGETFSDYSIPPTGVTGALTLGPGPTYFTNTTINDGNPDGEVQFNTLTNNFTFNYQGNGLGTWIQGLRFEMPDPNNVASSRVIAVKCDGCEDDVAYFDKETGIEVPNPTFVDCPPTDVNIVSSVPLDVNVIDDDDFDVEQVFLCDDNGVFIRQYTYVDGVFTSTTDLTLAGAPYVTVGTVANDCPTAVNTSFTRQLCDDNGPFNRTFVYDIDGNLISFADQSIISGAPYTPVGIVISCNSHDAQWITLCDDNGPFLRRISFFNQGAFVNSVDDFLLDAVTLYATVGTVHVCTADDNPPAVATQIDSTVQRQTGAGAIAIPAGARSITFISLAGAPTVTINGDPAVAVPAGASLSWSVDDSGEQLLNAHTFTGGAADDFIVITTRL